jgi:PAS domain S-box-containing protein
MAMASAAADAASSVILPFAALPSSPMVNVGSSEQAIFKRLRLVIRAFSEAKANRLQQHQQTGISGSGSSSSNSKNDNKKEFKPDDAYTTLILRLRAANTMALMQYDGIINAVVITDTVGTILGFNETAQRLFERNVEETLGHNVSELMPNPWSAAHDKYMSNYLKTGHKYLLGTPRSLKGIRWSDGSVFPVEVSLGEKILSRTDRVFIALIRDLSVAQQLKNNASVYEQNFEELRRLGHGAFGTVFKCRNRLRNHFLMLSGVQRYI